MNVIMDTSIRRAVVIDGKIFDKKDHKNLPETQVVSLLLEKERERLGERNISRFTTTLIEQSIRMNDPVLWSALRDDILTEDFVVHAAYVVLQSNDVLPALFITCITNAKNVQHLLDMFFVLFHIVQNIDDSSLERSFSKAISTQWKSFTNVLLQVVETTTDRKFKESLYLAMSKFIDVVDLQRESIISTMDEILKCKKFELLTIFASIEASVFSEMLPKLLQAAKLASATNRYAVMGLIAKILSETDVRSDDILPVVKIIVERTVQDKFVDKRTLKSLAFIIQKISDDPILKNFAIIITWDLNM